MARSNDDLPTLDSSLDAGSPPAHAPAANPGTEPHTAPSLTTSDRRTVDASTVGAAVYDDRKQLAVDPHRKSLAGGERFPVKNAVEEMTQAMEPRLSPTGTMGASGEHARLPERD